MADKKSDPDRTWVEPLISRMPYAEPGSFDRMLRRLAAAREQSEPVPQEGRSVPREPVTTFDEAPTLRWDGAVARWRASRRPRQSVLHRARALLRERVATGYQLFRSRKHGKWMLVALMLASAAVGLGVGRWLFATSQEPQHAGHGRAIRSARHGQDAPSGRTAGDHVMRKRHPTSQLVESSVALSTRPVTERAVLVAQAAPAAGGAALGAKDAAPRDPNQVNLGQLNVGAAAALFAGRLAESARLYDVAAKQTPGDPTFASIADILRRRVARMCRARPTSRGFRSLCGDR